MTQLHTKDHAYKFQVAITIVYHKAVDPRCRFTNFQKQLLAPFVVYADFESILRADEDITQGVAVGGDETTPAAGPFQEHLTCSFALPAGEQCGAGLLQAFCLLTGERMLE